MRGRTIKKEDGMKVEKGGREIKQRDLARS